MAPPPLPPENQYGHSKKLRFLLDEIAHHRAMLGRPAVLLDFGCGNGSAVSQHLMGEGIQYYGVDIHGPSLSHARAQFGGPQARFLDRIPAGVTFDIIVYADVLEHVPDPSALMGAHRAHLASDGIMMGAVPNGYGPFENEQRIDRWLGLSRLLSSVSKGTRRLLGKPRPQPAAEPPYNHESGHVFFFTRRSLDREISDAGLEVERFAHGAFMGASISGVILGRSRRLRHWNVAIADRLPHWMVSTWYFTLRNRCTAS